MELGARNRHVIDPHQLPRSPLDEPTLINGGDGLSKAVGNRLRKETLTGGTDRPVSMTGEPHPPMESSRLRLELFSIGFVSRISF